MALKTYLLAPNFTFEPDGPIRIGRIIADPFRPTKPLHVPVTEPTTATHTDFENSFSHRNSVALHGSIWAQFLQSASANIGAGISRDVLEQYTMDSLETIRMKEDLTDSEAAELARIPAVQTAMRAGVFGDAPVYMITGIKIAKGFRLGNQTSCKHEAQAGLNVPVTEEIGTSAEASVARTNATRAAFRSGNDIIFAYQLHVIAKKKWWSREISADVFDSPAAFLDKAKPVDEVDDVYVKTATSKQLKEIAEEYEEDNVETVEVPEEWT